MQPYLKRNKEASVSAPVDVIERKSDSGEEYDVMDSASDDLITAVHAKDTKGVSAALRAAHELHKSEADEQKDHSNE